MDETAAEETAAEEIVTERPAPVRTTSVVGIIIGLIGVAVAISALAYSHFTLSASLDSTRSEIRDLEQHIDAVGSSLDAMSETVDGIAKDAATAALNNTEGESSPAPAVEVGFLPRFTGQGADPATGMTLTRIEGEDGYSDGRLAFDPADGMRRVWMVWAHWCPHCQRELPELSAWWPEAKGDFPNSDFVTISTSIDASRGNPLDEYLVDGQFPFPVVVDQNGALAAQLGVNAFPFWIVTDGDGTVLFRTTGALGMEQVEQLFVQLEQFNA